jgi:peptide methionine sulfoxide reductase MsrA
LSIEYALIRKVKMNKKNNNYKNFFLRLNYLRCSYHCRCQSNTKKNVKPEFIINGHDTIHGIVICVLVIIAVTLAPEGICQENADYIAQYNSGDHKTALAQINKELREIYSRRVEDKRIPSEFISLKNTEQDINLIELFRKRKAQAFFIEDNANLAQLHLYAARCNEKLNNNSKAVSHYFQSLRFRKLTYGRDDVLFYELAGVYKKEKLYDGYHASLETAYSLNNEKYSYARELGNSLYRTREKKRALYYLEQFVTAQPEKTDSDIYIKLASLNEDIHAYLKAEHYYQKYLELEPEDGSILFALGYLAMKRTGNFELASASLQKSMKLLPENDSLRRSQVQEYLGDMTMHDLLFNAAVQHYKQAISYQQKVKNQILEKEKKITEITDKINTIKTSLLNAQNYDEYEEYEYLMGEKGKMQLDLRLLQHSYNKLHAGKVRWNTAYCYERLEQYPEAINYYRESIAFNHRANDARDQIIKLQLKIKRGY